jgi:hypothetical protein
VTNNSGARRHNHRPSAPRLAFAPDALRLCEVGRFHASHALRKSRHRFAPWAHRVIEDLYTAFFWGLFRKEQCSIAKK